MSDYIDPIKSDRFHHITAEQRLRFYHLVGKLDPKLTFSAMLNFPFNGMPGLARRLGITADQFMPEPVKDKPMTTQPTSLNADQRTCLRKLLVAHPNWQSHRRSIGVDSSTITVTQMLEAARLFSIDPQLYMGESMPSAPVAKPDLGNRFSIWRSTHIKYDTHVNDDHDAVLYDVDKATAIQKLKALLPDYPTAMAWSFETSQFHTLAELDPQPMQPTTQPFNPVYNAPPIIPSDPMAALTAAIGAIAGQAVNPEQIARIVDERITAALAKQPTIKIECKGFDGKTRELEGHQHPLFKDLLKSCTSRLPNGYVPNHWITGPAGSGKTHAASMIAKALGLSFYFNGAIDQQYHLIGHQDAHGTYHKTPFREAFEHGGVYCFDEVDASDNTAILPLNPALSNNKMPFPDGRIVERHPDCIVIATANTHGLGATADYVGRCKLDGAFLDRFQVRYDWQYDETLELAISGNEEAARYVQEARKKAREAGLKVIISPRASQGMAALMANGFTLKKAANLTFLANLTKEQRKQVEP